MATPQFQLYRSGEDNDWYWRFIANANVIFRSSEGYKNRVDAVRAIEIARASASADRIEQKADGKWYNFTA